MHVIRNTYLWHQLDHEPYKLITYDLNIYIDSSYCSIYTQYKLWYLHTIDRDRDEIKETPTVNSSWSDRHAEQGLTQYGLIYFVISLTNYKF